MFNYIYITMAKRSKHFINNKSVNLKKTQQSRYIFLVRKIGIIEKI